MRTTLTIDDDLLREAKLRAARTGRTVSEVLETAVRESFARRADRREHVDLPVSGMDGGLQPGVTLDDNAALRDLLDEGIPIENLR